MNFLERAKCTISIGAPVIRLRPRTKIAMDTDWPSLATTDLATIEKWNQETPDANCAAVAKAELGGAWFLEIDNPEIPARIENETGQKIPPTYRVRSRPGRGHYYWRQTPESISLGNIAQEFVKNKDFSVRVNTQYVVAANSLHPISGNPYEIVSTAPIAEAPFWLIEWLKSQRIEKKVEPKNPDELDIISEGGRNVTLASIAGKLRQAGLDYDALEYSLLSINHTKCVPPLPDDEVRVIANSICKYKIGSTSDIVLHGGQPAGSVPDLAPRVTIQSSVQELENVQSIKPVPYPRFPEWVMAGTSIYEGLVKPNCDANSRYSYFMWLPAMLVLLNYLGGKVRVEHKNLNPSMFMISIGRRGKVLKSSSVEDAIKYFEYAGIIAQDHSGISNADGKALVMTPASPEGLGKELQRTMCRNAVLFFDELSLLVNKASIESSALMSVLLTAYEGGKLQNLIKGPKDSYSLLPGNYCLSLMACSTDKNFAANWSKLSGKSTGLDDRTMFILQPEVLKPLTPHIQVDTQLAAIRTRQLIDKAVAQGLYRIVDSSPLSKFTAENNDANRMEIRAEKFALGLAVDLGLDELDENVIERGLAIVAYEQAVKRYLKTYEAVTKEGSVQMEILYNLRTNGGSMQLRELQRVMNATRYGTSLWSQAYVGLYKAGWIEEKGTGTKGDPKMTILLRVPEDDD